MEKYIQMIVSAGVEQKLKDTNDTIINVINPLIVINPVFFPTLYSFALTILLTGIDLTGKEVIEIQVTSPNNVRVFTTGESNSPQMPLGSDITLNLDLKNVMLQDEGKYQIDFRLDKEVLASTNFFVKRVEVGQ